GSNPSLSAPRSGSAAGDCRRRQMGRVPRMTETWPPADEFDTPEDNTAGSDNESLLDRIRGTGVGVEDPNIVGDVGPTDVPPGRDGPGDGLFADAPREP